MENRKKNAIENRIDSLTELWNEFAQDKEALLLRWLVGNDERQMIDVFLEVENEAEGTVPDLFLIFEMPFDNNEQYSDVLIESLEEQYQASKEELAKGEIDTGWYPPVMESETSPGRNFVNQCISLKKYYGSLMEHLVIVLLPESISNPEMFQQWLQVILQDESAAELRFMIVDYDSAPLYEDLAQAMSKLIKTIKPQLDMPGALTEIVQNVPGQGPDKKFRCHLVALTNAADKGDLDTARSASNAALMIAREQNWFQMQVVAHMALGATFLGAQKFADALSCYRDAGKASEDAIKEGDPAGKKLLMQSRLAGGSAFISDGQFENAAKVYELTVPLTQEIEDTLMTMECWRMAAYCHEQTKHYEQAWECGLLALSAGGEMDEDDRIASTLAYASQGLLRVAESRQDHSGANQIKEKTAALLGSNWQDSLQGAT